MIELTKTNKSPSEFEGLQPDHSARLELFDKRKNHNKFWHIFVYDRFVVRHWGRHGSKGQWSVHEAWNRWGAREAGLDLIRQKAAKGYKVEVGVLDRFAREIG